MSPFIWLGVAAVMGIVEVISFGLITMWFVVGALIAFLANLLGFDLVVQLVVFFVVSIVCLIVLRPMFLKYRKRGEKEEPDVVGQAAIVIETIDNERLAGRVETANRMTWAAKSADGAVLPAGETVVITGRESIRLIVERKPS
ncbi:NfeD family protein [Raoultibacter phocaeensis]|uniref:NfeD family protein n=1 Tax=Raoultibacter phocaeensis TaxID=2479841 RepID=UPI00111A3676|nr:NfeD family protein [Raoultibacter phocaeensis]